MTLVMTATTAASAARNRTPALDRTPPTSPTDFRLVAIDQTSATVSWSPSTDDRGVMSYSVWAEGTGNGVVSVPHPGTTATVRDLDPGQSYVLKVQAFDAPYNGSAAVGI
jgi:cellulose 1,4-beta-cellobiosidase